MDRSFVQAKTSRTRIATGCDIGNGTAEIASRGMLCAATCRRLPARAVLLAAVRHAGTGKPRFGLAHSGLAHSGLDRMSSGRGCMPKASHSPCCRGSLCSRADRLTVRLSFIASTTDATTSNAVKRSSYR